MLLRKHCLWVSHLMIPNRFSKYYNSFSAYVLTQRRTSKQSTGSGLSPRLFWPQILSLLAHEFAQWPAVRTPQNHLYIYMCIFQPLFQADQHYVKALINTFLLIGLFTFYYGPIAYSPRCSQWNRIFLEVILIGFIGRSKNTCKVAKWANATNSLPPSLQTFRVSLL